MNPSPLNCSVILSPWDYDQGDNHLEQEGTTTGTGAATGSVEAPHRQSRGDAVGALDPPRPPAPRRTACKGPGGPGPWQPRPPVLPTRLGDRSSAGAHLGPLP